MEQFVLNLRLFDGAAGAAGTGGAAGAQGAAENGGAAGTGGTAAAEGAAEGTRGQPRQGKNALSNVRYGKSAEAKAAPGAQPGGQESAAEPSAEESSREAQRAAFEELIKGEYKDLFHERVKGIIDARFKEAKGCESRLNAMQPMMDTLCAKYGVKQGDMRALREAIESDDSCYEDEADRRGLTVKQLKTFKRMEQENAAFRKAHQEAERRESANRIYARWQSEADACAKIYPDFSLRKECQSPQTGERFLTLLQNGIDVKTAFELIHKDELLSGAIRYAVANTQKRTMDSIRARGRRPGENGAGGSAPAQIAKRDVTRLTRADRDEIGRRVMRGEKIEF